MRMLGFMLLIVFNLECSPKKIILLSQARSGSNWLAYCIENIAKIKVYWTHDFVLPWKPGIKTGLGVTASTISDNEARKDVIVLKGHNVEKDYVEKQLSNMDNSGVILIVRNYKEIKKEEVFGEIPFIDRYVKSIHNFDQCKFSKSLIYYEDLINDIETELFKLKNFLSEFVSIDDETVRSFIKNIDYHRRQSFEMHSSYAKTHPGVSIPIAFSNVTMHSDKLSHTYKCSFDKFIANKNKEMFDKYLKRYEEK